MAAENGDQLPSQVRILDVLTPIMGLYTTGADYAARLHHINKHPRGLSINDSGSFQPQKQHESFGKLTWLWKIHHQKRISQSFVEQK